MILFIVPVAYYIKHYLFKRTETTECTHLTIVICLLCLLPAFLFTVRTVLQFFFNCTPCLPRNIFGLIMYFFFPFRFIYFCSSTTCALVVFTTYETMRYVINLHTFWGIFLSLHYSMWAYIAANLPRNHGTQIKQLHYL